MEYSATAAVAKFKCLQADCPDTCCKGWSMQLDDTTFAKYASTELEQAVAYDGAAQEIRVMKRDPQTDYCVKFSAGICAIHASRGDEFLGDACHFYPRVTRKFGDAVMMTATMSCPEIARLMLFEDTSTSATTAQTEREPQNLHNYLPENMLAAQAQKLHQVFLDACIDESISAEKLLARIFSAAQSLHYIAPEQWADAAGFMLRMAEGKLPESIPDKHDYYKLLQIFAGVLHATKKKPNERLSATLNEIQKALGVQINWEDLQLRSVDAGALDWTIAKWKKTAAEHDALLKKLILAQLSFGTFPLAGIGENIIEKTKLLIFRFTFTKLALMSLEQNAGEDEIVRSIQSISRIIDHLSDPTLILNLFEESGWVNDARICGLIEGA